METANETPGAGDVLNANRNHFGGEETSSATAAQTREVVPGRPIVAATGFDWARWWPWMLAALLLLMLVWTLTRKSGGGSVAA